MMSKYINPWIKMIDDLKTDTIYTNFNSIGAGTGRMSSNDPNMQNVAPEIRNAIVPRPGYYFISMDYDQVEYRILAALAGLDHIIDLINNDEDVHKIAASLLHDTPIEEVEKAVRDKSKTLNFGLVYGMGIKSLAHQLGLSEEETEVLYNKYKQKFLRGTDWFDRVVEFGKKHGYVMTSYGRKRRIENLDLEIDYQTMSPAVIRERKHLFGKAKRKAINTPIQGTSADIIKIATRNVFNKIEECGLDVHPLLIVHDDILYEVHESIKPEEIVPVLKSCMEMMFKDKVKLTVDCNISNLSWGALKG